MNFQYGSHKVFFAILRVCSRVDNSLGTEHTLTLTHTVKVVMSLLFPVTSFNDFLIVLDKVCLYLFTLPLYIFPIVNDDRINMVLDSFGD